MRKVTYEEVVKSLEIIGDIRFYDEDEEMMTMKDYFDSEYHLLKAFINQHKKPSELSESQNIISHKALLDEIHETYKEKNQKYGDSFTETVKKYGMIAAITRMHDKFNRIQNIVLKKAEDDEDERLVDSLKDLANYCLMTAMVLEDKDD